MSGLFLERLSIRALRIVARAEIEPAPRLNVISGNNGQGKTTLLEAIYLLATSRSFRTARLAELVAHGEDVASVRGSFAEVGGLTHEQSLGIERGRRVVRLAGEEPPSLAHYATRSPVVLFDPQQMALSTGPAIERRRLLDRVALFRSAALAAHRGRYDRALRGRQRWLLDRAHGERSGELDAYESLLAEHGAAITRARAEACRELAIAVADAFARIAAPELSLSLRYQPGGHEDAAAARDALAAARRADAQRKRTGVGPHLDDLALSLDGHPARVVASQGQHRALTLALKIAELRCIAAARRLEPILLLDDVSSELDPERTAALFSFLTSTQSQLFLTTTRPELIEAVAAPGERRDFMMKNGQITVL